MCVVAKLTARMHSWMICYFSYFRLSCWSFLSTWRLVVGRIWSVRRSLCTTSVYCIARWRFSESSRTIGLYKSALSCGSLMWKFSVSSWSRVDCCTWTDIRCKCPKKTRAMRLWQADRQPFSQPSYDSKDRVSMLRAGKIYSVKISQSSRQRSAAKSKLNVSLIFNLC